jgi:metal-responsive CopG/Arc/MetJ family transcriptional regulator
MKIVDKVSDTVYSMGMPNKRADNIKRVTITIDDELLYLLEAECKRAGVNRLEVIREAIATHVKNKQGKQSKQDTEK